MISINNLTSLCLIVLSASLIAFGSFARKYLIAIDGIYMTMLVCFVGGGVLMWWIVSISSFKKILPLAWRSIFIRVVLGLLAQLLFFVSLSKGSLLITVLLFNTSPLFIPLIRFLLYRQSVSYLNLFCILVSFFGIYLILGVDGGEIGVYSLCALFSGVLNAASQVVLHSASQKEDVFIINLWIYTFIGMFLLALFPFEVTSVTSVSNIFNQSSVIWICIAIIVFSISSQIFRVKAFKYTHDPSLIAPGMYFSVIVAGLLDIIFYNNSVSYLEVCGVIMICVSSILSIVKTNKKGKS